MHVWYFAESFISCNLFGWFVNSLLHFNLCRPSMWQHWLCCLELTATLQPLQVIQVTPRNSLLHFNPRRLSIWRQLFTSMGKSWSLSCIYLNWTLICLLKQNIFLTLRPYLSIVFTWSNPRTLANKIIMFFRLWIVPRLILCHLWPAMWKWVRCGAVH